MAHAGAVERLARVLVGRGGRGAVRARRVLDSGSAGRAPANAGREGGQEQRLGMGKLQGDKGYVQDVLAHALGAGWDKMAWW